jgi:hypothetical protein
LQESHHAQPARDGANQDQPLDVSLQNRFKLLYPANEATARWFTERANVTRGA